MLDQLPNQYPIVLTPGYQDNERKMSWLASFMRLYGLHPVIISPQPTDASVGIDVLAMQLAEQIEAQFDANQRVHYFGFSMGGLIGRYYLQRLGGHRRIQRFITLATPHLGSWTARLMPPRPALIQMYPDSEFLADLNQDVSILAQHDFIAYWTPFDLSVTPSHNSFLPSLPSKRLLSPFHGTLLSDPVVMRELTTLFKGNTAPSVAA